MMENLLILVISCCGYFETYQRSASQHSAGYLRTLGMRLLFSLIKVYTKLKRLHGMWRPITKRQHHNNSRLWHKLDNIQWSSSIRTFNFAL